MFAQEISNRARKPLSPRRVVGVRGPAPSSPHPRDHAHRRDQVEESLDLCIIDRGDSPALVGRTKVREDIRDVVCAQAGAEVLDRLFGTKRRDAVDLLVVLKPKIVAEPAVLKPDSVAAQVMTTVVRGGTPRADQ